MKPEELLGKHLDAWRSLGQAPCRRAIYPYLTADCIIAYNKGSVGGLNSY